MIVTPPKAVKKDENKSWPKHPVTDWVLSNGAKTLRATEKAYRVTGLDEYDRTSIWNLLGTAKFKLSMLGRNYTSGTMRSVSIDCQFLLTLAILRRNYDYIEVSELANDLSDLKFIVSKIMGADSNRMSKNYGC